MSNPYKLVTIRSAGWAAFDQATLLISVGQPYHEGDKFAATAEWAARHFEHLHVLVADVLQRHNEPGDWTARGTEWIARNRAAWVHCSREVTLSRWNDWLAAPELPAVLAEFATAAEASLRTAVERDADAFVRRQSAKGRVVSIEQSRRYLLEELAVITLQARRYPGARIYPGPELASFRAVAAGHAAGVPSSLERQYHTAIDFKRRRRAAVRSASDSPRLAAG